MSCMLLKDHDKEREVADTQSFAVWVFHFQPGNKTFLYPTLTVVVCPVSFLWLYETECFN